MAFALVRVPLMHQPFVGEDGMFARIMRASWASGQTPLTIRLIDHDVLLVHGSIAPQFQGLVGRIGGRDLFISLEHPALLYRGLSWIGHLSGGLGPDDRSPLIGPFLRGEAAAAGLVIWLPLVMLGVHFARDRWAALIAIVAACSPLPALTSTLIQLDGSVGVLMIGALAIALLAATRRGPRDGRTRVTVAAAAFCVGLGKQEWSIAVLAGVALYAVVLLVSTTERAELSQWRGVIAVLVGAVIAGNLASYALDSLNYLGGFRVMRAFGVSETTLGANLWRWVRVSYTRLPMVVALLPMLAVIGAAAVARMRGACRLHPMALLLGTCALGLAGIFLASAWNSTPRYLAPGFVAAVAALIAILPSLPPAWARRAAQLIVVSALMHTVWLEQRWVREPARPREATVARRDCLPRRETAVTWNRPDVDFVTADIDPRAAADIASAFGHVLCQ